MQIKRLLKEMLEKVDYCKKICQKHLKKEPTMTKEHEGNFQMVDKFHICGKSFLEKEIRERDHCHVTCRYRDSAHKTFNASFQLTNKIIFIFHNLRRYHSHLIMQEVDKFSEKINVIPNDMEKYIRFILGKKCLH